MRISKSPQAQQRHYCKGRASLLLLVNRSQGNGNSTCYRYVRLSGYAALTAPGCAPVWCWNLVNTRRLLRFCPLLPALLQHIGYPRLQTNIARQTENIMTSVVSHHAIISSRQNLESPSSTICTPAKQRESVSRCAPSLLGAGPGLDIAGPRARTTHARRQTHITATSGLS